MRAARASCRYAALCRWLVFAFLVNGAFSSLLSSSSLQACNQGGTTDGGTTMSCSQKMVVTLSVPTGQALQTQSLQATLTQTVDSTGATHTLATPMSISLTKTPVYSVYPLTYTSSYNAKPYEIVELTSDCVDGALVSDPTCGWFLNADGSHVPDSQGFCCVCDAAASWQQTVLGGPTDTSRGNVNCNLFTAGLFLNGVPASASCLRLDPQWFAAYAISVAEVEFTITVSLSPLAGNASGSAGSPPPPPSPPPSSLTLSPVSLVAVTPDQTVAAELLGDLGGYMATPVLSTMLLFIPIPSNGSANSGDPALWPILPVSGVSQDGTQCNMPGTGFRAFRNQPNACREPAGTCLANQLTDIINADAVLTASGATPKHNLASLGVAGGPPSLRDAQQGASQPTLKRLALPTTALRNSLVALTLNADAIKFVVNVSPGRIVSASLLAFNGHNASGFVSLSGNGWLSATFANNGTIAAAFYVSVVNCSAGVALIASEGAVSVAAGGNATQMWPCSVEDSAAANRNCTIVLQNANFVVIDTKLVLFYTNSTQYDAIPTLNGIALGTGVGSLRSGGGSCASDCPNLLNLVCPLFANCWTRLFEGIMIYVALLGFAFWSLRCGPCRLASSLASSWAAGGGKGATTPGGGAAAPSAALRQRDATARCSPPPEPVLPPRHASRGHAGAGHARTRRHASDVSSCAAGDEGGGAWPGVAPFSSHRDRAPSGRHDAAPPPRGRSSPPPSTRKGGGGGGGRGAGKSSPASRKQHGGGGGGVTRGVALARTARDAEEGRRDGCWER